MLFYGQGKVYIGERDSSGNPLALRWVGNCPMLKLGFTLDMLEHKESYSGQALTDLKLVKGKTCEMSCTIEEFNAANLALALAGTANTVAAGSAITDEVLNGSTTPAVGHVYVAAKRNGTTISIKDSTSGTAKTLVKDTNYSIEPKSMTVTMLNTQVGGVEITGPLKISYTPGGDLETAMFNAAQTDKFMRFVGMNLADNGKVVTVDLFKVSLSTTKELNLITEGLSSFPLEGAALMDTLRAASGTLGQFGAIYQET